MGAEQINNDAMYLRMKHVSDLTEILVSSSNKWYDIGLSLKLPEYILVELTRQYITYGSKACLS